MGVRTSSTGIWHFTGDFRFSAGCFAGGFADWVLSPSSFSKDDEEPVLTNSLEIGILVPRFDLFLSGSSLDDDCVEDAEDEPDNDVELDDADFDGDFFWWI